MIRLLCFLLLLSCTRKTEEFVIETLKKECPTCVDKFEAKRTSKCLNDSSKIKLYDDLLESTDALYDSLNQKVYKIVYNSQEVENYAKIYLLDNANPANSSDPHYLYFFIEVNNTSGQGRGEIGNVVEQNMVIRVSRTFNSSLVNALKTLSCASSEAGSSTTNNSDNGSFTNYVLTTKDRSDISNTTSEKENIYNFNIKSGRPAFLLIFDFTYGSNTFAEDGELITSESIIGFSLEDVTDTVPASTDVTFLTKINTSTKCDMDTEPLGTNNIPFDFAPLNCGLNYAIPNY